MRAYLVLLLVRTARTPLIPVPSPPRVARAWVIFAANARAHRCDVYLLAFLPAVSLLLPLVVRIADMPSCTRFLETASDPLDPPPRIPIPLMMDSQLGQSLGFCVVCSFGRMEEPVIMNTTLTATGA